MDREFKDFIKNAIDDPDSVQREIDKAMGIVNKLGDSELSNGVMEMIRASASGSSVEEINAMHNALKKKYAGRDTTNEH